MFGMGDARGDAESNDKCSCMMFFVLEFKSESSEQCCGQIFFWCTWIYDSFYEEGCKEDYVEL